MCSPSPQSHGGRCAKRAAWAEVSLGAEGACSSIGCVSLRIPSRIPGLNRSASDRQGEESHPSSHRYIHALGSLRPSQHSVIRGRPAGRIVGHPIEKQLFALEGFTLRFCRRVFHCLRFGNIPPTHTRHFQISPQHCCLVDLHGLTKRFETHPLCCENAWVNAPPLLSESTQHNSTLAPIRNWNAEIFTGKERKRFELESM